LEDLVISWADDSAESLISLFETRKLACAASYFRRWQETCTPAGINLGTHVDMKAAKT
jgi:hypothetical protein